MGVTPPLPARKSKSRKKALGKTLRLARRNKSSSPSGLSTTGVLLLPPPGDSTESRGVDPIHQHAISQAGVPQGTSSMDLGVMEQGDRALGDLASIDVSSATRGSWEHSLQGPLAVSTGRLADALSSPQGLDYGELVSCFCPQGQETDSHRPPGSRESDYTAVQSVTPHSASPRGMAETQDPGLRTRESGPGTRDSTCTAVRDVFPDSAGPRGLAEALDPGPGSRSQAPGTRDPGPGPSGPGSGTRDLAGPRGLAETRDPGPGTQCQAPGTRDSTPGPAGPGSGTRHSASSRELAEARIPGLGTWCQAPGTRDPGPRPLGLGSGTRDSAGLRGLPEPRDPGSGIQGQAPGTWDPGPRPSGLGPGSRDPTGSQGLGGTQAQALRTQDQGPGTRDSAYTTVQAGFPGPGQVQTYPPGFNPMVWPANLAAMAQAYPAASSATQSTPGSSAAQGCSSETMTAAWPGQIPFPWGPFGHMGWFPPGFGVPNPTVNPPHNAQTRFVTPRGVPNQSQGADVFKHYSPLTQPAHRPLPATSQARPDESPMEMSSSISSSSDEDSGTDGRDSVSSPWVAPSGATTQVPSSVEPELQGADTEGQRQADTPECATYEGALANVKSFLASSRDPQGYLINMRAPQRSQRRRLTSLLAGPAEPVRQEGLPWTPDMRSSLYRLNLSLRGVPKGLQRRYLREDLPLPTPDQSVMGRGVFPGKFTEGIETAPFRSFPNQLQGIPEPVDLSLQPPDIPHRLWAAHPQPPSCVNFTWKAAADTEGLVRQQASILSHVSWWNYALQLRLTSLSETLAEREPTLAQASREASAWAAASLTAATKALDANQTIMAELLLLRRDAVLAQTKLPRNRANQLRAAPLESTELLGPDFDELASTWSLEDEQAKTLGGKATHVAAQAVRKGLAKKKRPFLPQTAAQGQSARKRKVPSSAKDRGTQPGPKPKKKKKKLPPPQSTNLRGAQTSRQASR